MTRLPYACLAVQLAGLTVGLAGCAAPLAQVRLPGRVVMPSARVAETPTEAVATAAITSPLAMMAQQEVLAAVAGYTRALGEAERSRSSAIARQLLRPYLAAGRIEGLVQAMNAIWMRGESFTGQDVRHVSSVTVAGRHAFVHDCDTTSGMSLVDTASGQIVPGSSGTARANLVTRLDLVSGHWLVQFQLLEDVPCAP